MRASNNTQKTPLYTTWYDFRRDLGKHLGYIPLNQQWLQIKPRVALPWDESHIQASLSAIGLQKEHKAIKKQIDRRPKKL